MRPPDKIIDFIKAFLIPIPNSGILPGHTVIARVIGQNIVRVWIIGYNKFNLEIRKWHQGLPGWSTCPPPEDQNEEKNKENMRENSGKISKI